METDIAELLLLDRSYDTAEKAKEEIERLREQVKELATALEFEANYDGHKLLARSALQQKEND